MHIILIARHYPPEISGGARRPYLMTRALRGLGHNVTVVTPFESADADGDHIYVPHPVKNISQTPKEAALVSDTSIVSLRAILRQWLLWPDPDIRWARRVVHKLQDVSIKADWIITTSPPESTHLIGYKTASQLKCKWLAEFRDTWFLNPHRKVVENSWVRRTIEHRIAKRAFAHLDAVTAVSEAVMADIRQLIPKETPEIIIGHFSTPLSAEKSVQNRIALPKDDVNLVHSGGFSLSDRRRQLAPLLQSLANANRPELHLHIAGLLSPEEQSLAKSKHAFKVSLHGQVSLEQSQALQLDADGLLLITPENSHALPGKFSEYVLAGRPILFSGGGSWLSLVKDHSILNELDSGLKNITRNTPSVKTVDSSKTHMDAGKALANFLSTLYDAKD